MLTSSANMAVSSVFFWRMGLIPIAEPAQRLNLGVRTSPNAGGCPLRALCLGLAS